MEVFKFLEKQNWVPINYWANLVIFPFLDTFPDLFARFQIFFYLARQHFWWVE